MCILRALHFVTILILLGTTFVQTKSIPAVAEELGSHDSYHEDDQLVFHSYAYTESKELNRLAKGIPIIKKNVYSEYECDEELGEGMYAVVRSCNKKHDKNHKIAIKEMTLKNDYIKKISTRESHVLKRLKGCKGFPQHINTYKYKKKLYLLLEKIDGEMLSRMLHKIREGNRKGFTDKEIIKILHNILGFIEQLNSFWDMRICHDDIDESNIMIDENFNVYLIDFGLSKFLTRDQKEKDNEFICGCKDHNKYLNMVERMSKMMSDQSDVKQLIEELNKHNILTEEGIKAVKNAKIFCTALPAANHA